MPMAGYRADQVHQQTKMLPSTGLLPVDKPATNSNPSKTDRQSLVKRTTLPLPDCLTLPSSITPKQPQRTWARAVDWWAAGTRTPEPLILRVKSGANYSGPSTKDKIEH